MQRRREEATAAAAATAGVSRFVLGASSLNAIATPAQAHSRPSSAASFVGDIGLSDAQRVAAFICEITRLQRTTGSNDERRAMASFVLLRRAEHEAVQAALFGDESTATSSSSSIASPALHPLLSLLRLELDTTVLSHAIAMLIVSAGTFSSEAQRREFITRLRPTSSKSVVANGDSAPIASTLHLWSAQWSWNRTQHPHAPSICIAHIDALLSPLLLSVHPRDRRLSASLMKSPRSSRALSALQHLWTTGCEFVLSLLDASPQALLSIASLSLQGLSFAESLSLYLTASLQQPPLLASSALAAWRGIELTMATFLRANQTSASKTKDATASAVTSAGFAFVPSSPMWQLLSICFREMCGAPCCNCCSSSGGSSSATAASHSAAIDPFLLSLHTASPFVSLTSLLFRFVILALDEPSHRYGTAATMMESMPLLQLLLLHALCFHTSADATTISSSSSCLSASAPTTPAQSSLVLDAEYILTRLYFDSKRVTNLLSLFTTTTQSETKATASTMSSAFEARLPLYLPPAAQQFVAAHPCTHMQYLNAGLHSQLILRFPTPPSQTAGAASSLPPSSHSSHLLTFLLNLLKKFLLLNSDFGSTLAISSASDANTLAAASPSSGVVREVRETQSHQLGTTILHAFTRLLSDMLAAGLPPSSPHCRQIQSALLELFLWNTRGSVRIREVFDLAHWEYRRSSSAASPSSSRLSGADVLYGIAMRVLLCVVDAITVALQSSAGSGIGVDSLLFISASSMRDADASSLLPSLALGDHVSRVLQDVASVLAEARALGLHDLRPASALVGGAPKTLQLNDLFDLSTRSSHLTPPTRHFSLAAYLPVLTHVHGALSTMQGRVGPQSSTAAASTTVAASSTLLSPSLPSPSPSSTLLLSPLRRPYSSHTSRSPMRGGAVQPLVASVLSPMPPASSSRSPSYSPPSSANALGPLSPRALAGSARASAGRSNKPADSSSSPLTPLGSPRPIPAASPRASNSSTTTAAVTPRLDSLANGGTMPAISSPLRPLLVEAAAAASARANNTAPPARKIQPPAVLAPVSK